MQAVNQEEMNCKELANRHLFSFKKRVQFNIFKLKQ